MLQSQVVENRWPVILEHMSREFPGQIRAVPFPGFRARLLRSGQIIVGQSFTRQRPEQSRSVKHILAGIAARNHQAPRGVFYRTPKCRMALREKPRIMTEHGSRQKGSEETARCVRSHGRAKPLAVPFRALSKTCG